MKILDNISHTVREDLQDTMQKGAACPLLRPVFPFMRIRN